MLFQMPKETGCDFFCFIIIIIIIFIFNKVILLAYF